MPHSQIRTKYKAQKTIVGGVSIDSRTEARRWLELIAMQQSGAISGLQRQVRFEIVPAQPEYKERRSEYVADFVYQLPDGTKICEDAKSKFTKKLPTYILKRKLFKMRYCPEGWVFREWVEPKKTTKRGGGKSHANHRHHRQDSALPAVRRRGPLALQAHDKSHRGEGTGAAGQDHPPLREV